MVPSNDIKMGYPSCYVEYGMLCGASSRYAISALLIICFVHTRINMPIGSHIWFQGVHVRAAVKIPFCT